MAESLNLYGLGRMWNVAGTFENSDERSGASGPVALL
jgi:hypothetical protein